MLNPSETIHRWLCSTSTEPSAHVRAAYRQLGRYEDAATQHWMNWKIDEFNRVVESSRQLELALPAMNARDKVRTAVADYFDRVARPHALTNAETRISERLRDARGTFTSRTRRSDGKHLIIWDNKAGLRLLDPDDAREEAMRVQRRVVPAALAQLKQPGVRVYYGVFTMPNAAPGQLRSSMRKLSRRFCALMRKAKRDGSLPIMGAYSVMESPLGRRRDWHPHLNVLLITSGWLDFAQLRKMWHWNVELRLLEGTASRLEAAMREIIKYSVRTVPEKSNEKAQAVRGIRVDRTGRMERDQTVLRLQAPDDGRGTSSGGSAADQGARGGRRDGAAPTQEGEGRSLGDHDAPGDAIDGEWQNTPPALTEWSHGEFWEWIRAHKGFRRSRGYGCLYRLDDPKPEDINTGFETTHTGTRGPHGYVLRSALLESIPGDKSSTTHLDRYRKAIQHLLGPPDRARECLLLAKEAEQAWQTIRNHLQ